MWKLLSDIEKKIESWSAIAEQKGCDIERRFLNGKTIYEKQDELIQKIKEKFDGQKLY